MSGKDPMEWDPVIALTLEGWRRQQAKDAEDAERRNTPQPTN